jgi:hypothetical protein
MFKKFTIFWNKYGFETTLISIVFIIFVLSIFRRGKKGTWSETYFIPVKSYKKSVPKESKGEKECRRVLRNLFNRPFDKARPDILRNPVTGGDFNLELDCYDPELKIAVEYNGIQHYKFSPFFHSNKEAFQNQKYRDYMKREMCAKNGIKLIEVPYTVKIENIESYILQQLIQ